MVSAAHSNNNASEHSQPASPKYILGFGSNQQTGSHSNIFFRDNGSATPTTGSDLLSTADISQALENNSTYHHGFGLTNGYSSSMNSLFNTRNSGPNIGLAYNFEKGAIPLSRSSTERFHINSAHTNGIPHQLTPTLNEITLDEEKSGSKSNINPKNPKLYKTELCRSWIDHGRCNYGDRCQYAHGENEKRPIPRHPKYKTEACQSYHKTGYCPYGPRCHFIHNEDPTQLAQMIAANAAASAAASIQPLPPTQQPLPSQHRPKNLHIPLSSSASAPVSTINTPVGSVAAGVKTPLPLSTPIQQDTPSLQLQHEIIASTPKQNSLLYRKNADSTGGSPIPSSADSGNDSPLGSFSPGFELDESLSRLSPNSFRRSISSNSTGLTALLNTYGGTTLGKSSGSKVLNALGGLSSSSRASQSFSDWSTNTLNKGINGLSLGNNSSSSLLSDSDSSGIGRTPPNGHARAPNDLPKSATLGAMPTHHWPSSNSTSPNRLPVFERLSNGPL